MSECLPPEGTPDGMSETHPPIPAGTTYVVAAKMRKRQDGSLEIIRSEIVLSDGTRYQVPASMAAPEREG